MNAFRYHRQAKPTKRWKSAEVPEFDPNWIVVFNFPGQSKPDRKTAVLYPICGLCLAVPVGENPVEKRGECKCQVGLRKWAQAHYDTRMALLRRQEFDRLEELRRPARAASLQEVVRMYDERGPADKAQRLNALKLFFEQGTGRPFKQMTWEDLTRERFLDWAEMRQEAGRRGWLGQGRAMPEDGWALLRAAHAEGKLPALDTRTAAAWNTTLLGALVKIKSIVGDDSRQLVLRGLEVPALKEFRATVLDLPTPKGHKALKAEQLQAILEGADVLKRENLRLWVVNQMLMRLACRPEEVEAATPEWLEAVKQGGKDRTRIAIINREGFTLKAGSGAKERRIWLPPDLEQAVREVMTPTSLIGARTKTEARQLVDYEHSKWLRRTAGIMGGQTNYLLRHMGAAERMTSQGADAASDLLGNSRELICSTYGRQLETLEPIGDEELLRRLVEG